jgi:lysophospholipase L1-like esterase
MKRSYVVGVAVIFVLGIGIVAAKMFHLPSRFTAARLAWFDPFDSRAAPFAAESQQQSRRSIQMRNAAVFIGDSITVGLATSNIAPHSENFGIDGDTVDGLITRLPRYDLTKARVIVLEIGVNNYHRDKLTGFEPKYRQLLGLLPHGIPVVAMAIFPINEHASWWVPVRDATEAIKKANKEIALACQQVSTCTFLDLSPSLGDAGGSMKSIYEVGDGIHLSEPAYAVWASALAPHIPKEARCEQ